MHIKNLSQILSGHEESQLVSTDYTGSKSNLHFLPELPRRAPGAQQDELSPGAAKTFWKGFVCLRGDIRALGNVLSQALSVTARVRNNFDKDILAEQTSTRPAPWSETVQPTELLWGTDRCYLFSLLTCTAAVHSGNPDTDVFGVVTGAELTAGTLHWAIRNQGAPKMLQVHQLSFWLRSFLNAAPVARFLFITPKPVEQELFYSYQLSVKPFWWL